MKKLLAVVLCLVASVCMFACGDKESDSYEIAMITDKGTIDDKSFNQGTWEGIKEFAEENDKTYKYYQPTEDSYAARMEQIDLAVKGGAKIIATPGFLFEECIYDAQEKYPDVKFILIDGRPHDKDYKNFKTADNTVSILFAEQEAGYLAGYAAVQNGYTKLGFMGGQPVPAVTRYGYGFVQGANDAAAEKGITVDMKFSYADGFSPSPEIQTKAAGWYADGTEVIFSCGGGIYSSITAAAEASEGKAVIGVDVDQSSESETIVTSAMKGLKVAVVKELKAYYDDKFAGGEDLTLSAKDDAVALPMDTSKLDNFSEKQYKKLLEKVKKGEVTIPTDTDAEKADGLNVPNVKVQVVA